MTKMASIFPVLVSVRLTIPGVVWRQLMVKSMSLAPVPGSRGVGQTSGLYYSFYSEREALFHMTGVSTVLE